MLREKFKTTMKATMSILWVLVLLARTECAKHVVKRSDDPNHLESVVMQLSSQVDLLQAKVSVMQTKLDTKDGHVAFLAQFSTSYPETPSSGPFCFDKAIFNDGNAYDPTFGIFTAPVSGVYVFSAQFFTRGAQDQRPLLDILVNGVTHVRLAFDAEANDQAVGSDSDSTTFSIKLKAGDRVWVAASATQIFHLFGLYHTFFSGALLYSE